MFTIFDIIIFITVVISSMLGLHKGMINIIVNLLGFIISILLAIFMFPYIKSVLVGNVENELVISILSGIIAYICSLFIVTVIVSQVSKLLKFISCGFFDRTFGLIIGALRGILISMIVFAIIAIFTTGAYLKAKNGKELISGLDADKYPEWLKVSKTTSYLEDLLKRSTVLISEEFLESIKLPKADEDNGEDIIDSIKKSKTP